MNPEEAIGQNLERALVRLPSEQDRFLAEFPPIDDNDLKVQKDSLTIVKKKQAPDEGQRRNDEVVFWQSICEIAGIRSKAPKALYIVQIRQSFINTYFSADVIELNRSFYHTFYWSAPHNLGLHASRDGLCLVHLGMKFQDRKLLVEGQKRHIAAINHLRHDLEKAKTMNSVDDGVIAAAFTLGNTEVYNTASDVGTGYLQHMEGIYHLFRKRGPGNIDSEFAQALLHNSRHPAVMHCILRRKPCLFSEPEWIDAANKTPTFGVRLTNLAIKIPALLQRADGLGTEEDEVVALLSELVALENDFQDWLIKFYELTCPTEAPYRTRSILGYPKFSDLCAGLAHVFPTMLEFPSFVSATSHIYVWICMLVLRRAILAVAGHSPRSLVRKQNQEATLTASVNECAISLCQSVAYLSCPEYVSCGILACSGPLHFAGEWFEEQHSVQRLAWTRNVRSFLERDSLLGDTSNNRHRLDPPLFLYWMLPNFIDDRPESRSERERRFQVV